MRALSCVPTSMPSIARRIVTGTIVFGSIGGTPLAANPPIDTSISVHGMPPISISAGTLARR